VVDFVVFDFIKFFIVDFDVTDRIDIFFRAGDRFLQGFRMT
jgi:hypothetical protein